MSMIDRVYRAGVEQGAKEAQQLKEELRSIKQMESVEADAAGRMRWLTARNWLTGNWFTARKPMVKP